MKPRPAVTLMEVLIAIFVMGIGMLSLLTLFPVGALNMSQAMRDDRAAQAARNATALAAAFNLRKDANVVNLLSQGQVVYVDPFYAVLGSAGLGAGGNAIRRVRPSYVKGNADLSRFFSLLDDVGFLENGQASGPSTGPLVARAGAFTWAYLLRPVPGSNPVISDMTVAVYSGRSTQVQDGETPVSAAGAQGTSQITITSGTELRRGVWVLDLSLVSGKPAAQFYRIVSVNKQGASQTLETQTPLINSVDHIVVMEKVAEIFTRGTGWQP